MRLNAKQLRASRPKKSEVSKIKRRQIYIICDNILDTYNIGSIFRLADAVAASGVYLCGQTQTPPYHRIAKAAVGTEKWVPWKHLPSAKASIEELRRKFSTGPSSSHSGAPRSGGAIESMKKRSYRSLHSLHDDKRGIKVVAIEQSPKSIDYRKADLSEPVALIVGHETSGVSKEALILADQIVELPMYGVNRSLNVMVSLAIVLFKAVERG